MMFNNKALIAALASVHTASAQTMQLLGYGFCTDQNEKTYDRLVNALITTQEGCSVACLDFPTTRGMEVSDTSCSCLFDDGQTPPAEGDWTEGPANGISDGAGPVKSGDAESEEVICFRANFPDDCSYDYVLDGYCVDDSEMAYDQISRSDVGDIYYCQLLCGDFKDQPLRGIEYRILEEGTPEEIDVCGCLFDDGNIPSLPDGWTALISGVGVGPVAGNKTDGGDNVLLCQPYYCPEVEDPFTLVGGGVCVDANRFQYDKATVTAIAPDQCKEACFSTHQNVTAIRGMQFSFDADLNTRCDCLVDDGSYPPEFEDLFFTEYLGTGPITASDNIAGNWECYSLND